jgi:BirA family biotin operon repressor/biotin-[acetyl-CoA-carboxylase] ligase
MIIGSKLIFIDNAESTNTVASGLIKSGGIREGTIIYTNFQKAGRGQKGNHWESEDGKNLLFSIILYPYVINAGDQFIISMIISLGIYDFLKQHTTTCRIKWPNDIYADDGKIAGILIENSISAEYINSTVAGIGLNINQINFPAHIPNPVSLRMVTGVEFDLMACFDQIISLMDIRYKQLISGDHVGIRDEYISKLYRLNEWVEFKTDAGILKGRIVSVDDTGMLMVEEKNNKIKMFGFKEIEFS